MGAASGIRDTTPDVRVSDVIVLDQLQEVHLDPLVERDTNGARLSASPADSLDLRVAVIKRPGPLLAKRGIRIGSDPLVEPENTGRNPHQIQGSDGQSEAYDADPPSRARIEEAFVPESLRHRSNQRRRRIPHRSIGMEPQRWGMVVEAHAEQRPEGTLPAPRPINRVVKADKPAPRLQLI